MIKLLEAIFGHFIRLLLILFVPIMSGLGIYFILPPSYQASATLWAIRPYEILDATGTNSNSQTSPADTQVSALMELLQSRAFDIAVGKLTDLKSTFKLSSHGVTSANDLEDAYVSDISENVHVITKGNYSYAISYTNKDPRIASQVVGAVIAQFQTNLQTTLGPLHLGTTGTNSTDFFKILDAPLAVSQSRSRILLTAVGIGAGVGLVLCSIYTLILVRRDCALYTAPDVEKVTSYPLIMQVPRLRKVPHNFHRSKSLSPKTAV